MEFIFETTYDQAALTVMARALRKTYRKVKSLVIKIICSVIVVFGVWMALPLGGREFDMDLGSVLSYLSLAIMFVCIVWEDALNGFVAKKRLEPENADIEATFTDDGYETRTSVQFERWQYERIGYIAESKYYFVIIFNEHRAQVFDKDNLSGGSEEEFRSFLEEKTGKTMMKV